jgi:hypothetical protein
LDNTGGETITLKIEIGQKNLTNVKKKALFEFVVDEGRRHAGQNNIKSDEKLQYIVIKSLNAL